MVFDFQQDKDKIRTSSQHAGINLSSSSYTENIDFLPLPSISLDKLKYFLTTTFT